MLLLNAAGINNRLSADDFLSAYSVGVTHKSFHRRLRIIFHTVLWEKIFTSLIGNVSASFLYQVDELGFLRLNSFDKVR